MRLFGLLLLTACLGGCGEASELSHGPRHGGRYVGIGIYAPGALWQRMVSAGRPSDAAAANLRDDEQIIVTVDSETGEVRQCGNLSGHCIRMNPWSGPLGQERAAPVDLTEHQADLDSPARAAEPAPARLPAADR